MPVPYNINFFLLAVYEIQHLYLSVLENLAVVTSNTPLRQHSPTSETCSTLPPGPAAISVIRHEIILN